MGTPIQPAWIEKPDGGLVPVVGNCGLGRGSGNEVVLSDNRVSRRHAIIHAQSESEFWLVDLGSSNGTYLNGRRVNQPVRLRERDRFAVGPFTMTFRPPLDSGGPLTRADTGQATLVDIRTARCWLLVADIAGSTALSQSLPPDQLAVLIGGWFLKCREAIETRGGLINKYLGDGFFAYWTAADGSAAAVASAILQLRQLQELARPAFRQVLHVGSVSVGGAATMGEESLSGPAVNFVFRLEKLAGGLHQPRVLSEPAANALKDLIRSESLGGHPVPGFEGSHPLFGW
ncbi:MAG: FHA domain-containing protein [Limisphaerales bacterium]